MSNSHIEIIVQAFCKMRVKQNSFRQANLFLFYSLLDAYAMIFNTLPVLIPKYLCVKKKKTIHETNLKILSLFCCKGIIAIKYIVISTH